ncbi:hypothetical protein GALL_528120 [mine drainage metagenome]|uniref:Uncharacterized protein n=1 Tax=mine drainage metagenome TaxID=410659 RepID=A0A1J5PDN0_9ZZZZ
MGSFVPQGPVAGDPFRQANEHANNSCCYRSAFIDFRHRIRANDPHESLRRFDQQNHFIFFFDQSQ